MNSFQSQGPQQAESIAPIYSLTSKTLNDNPAVSPFSLAPMESFVPLDDLTPSNASQSQMRLSLSPGEMLPSATFSPPVAPVAPAPMTVSNPSHVSPPSGNSANESSWSQTLMPSDMMFVPPPPATIKLVIDFKQTKGKAEITSANTFDEVHQICCQAVSLTTDPAQVKQQFILQFYDQELQAWVLLSDPALKALSLANGALLKLRFLPKT